MIQRETSTTMRQVPGQIVISVFSTKRVLKLIRLRAPMLRDEASVKSLLCNSITRQMRYSRRNIGKESTTSTGTLGGDWRGDGRSRAWATEQMK